ncbi:hypothetical protein [Nitrosospira sp. NRS527]|uniref:hypothetical protein n=1 Tax=Nitrosospira sp. NRS527 TaxID=155925 RepID=UPI001BD0D835|nr:hypothetical protein [Nitrosospira sp. NRS527]
MKYRESTCQHDQRNDRWQLRDCLTGIFMRVARKSVTIIAITLETAEFNLERAR